MRPADKLPINIEAGLVVAISVLASSFLLLGWMSWQIPYPAKLQDYPLHLRHWLAWRIHGALPIFQDAAGHYQAYLDRIATAASPAWITGRLDGAFIGALTLALAAGIQVGRSRSAIKHLVGRQLLCGRQASRQLQKVARKECKESGTDISMHPYFNWHLSTSRASRHFLVWGSTGGGKTVAINGLLQSILKRGDRSIIFDSKGDFTTWLPSGILLAPWDARSYAWDISRDCRNAQEARELASQLIPANNSDPLWHTAARQILTAIVIKLQTRHPQSWTWQDLYDDVCLPREELLAIVSVHLPEALHVVNSADKTQQSILVNFSAHMSLIADLAKAWGQHPRGKRFSLIDWLDDASPAQKTVVLQGSGKFAALSQAYLQSIIALAAGHINSAAFPDSRERRLWFVLDEFPQMGKVAIAPLLEMGRSKDIRVVLGAQDISQIREIYGANTAASWLSMIGTQVVVRVNAGETANHLAKEVIGYRKIDRTLVEDGKRHKVREDVLVMEPSELSTMLGPGQKAVKAMMLGFGEAYILAWPFLDLRKRRAATVPAKWLKAPNQPAKQKERGAAPLIPSISTQPLPNAVQPVPTTPRLKLRPLNDARIAAMSGTSIQEAAESDGDMLPDTFGEPT